MDLQSLRGYSLGSGPASQEKSFLSEDEIRTYLKESRSGLQKSLAKAGVVYTRLGARKKYSILNVSKWLEDPEKELEPVSASEIADDMTLVFGTRHVEKKQAAAYLGVNLNLVTNFNKGLRKLRVGRAPKLNVLDLAEALVSIQQRTSF
ncbi:MAG: hypothetical protein LBT59_04325 [Clostridiales bacterium]|nr:hypothetical protein [Clostridiales bacterium]